MPGPVTTSSTASCRSPRHGRRRSCRCPMHPDLTADRGGVRDRGRRGRTGKEDRLMLKATAIGRAARARRPNRSVSPSSASATGARTCSASWPTSPTSRSGGSAISTGNVCSECQAPLSRRSDDPTPGSRSRRSGRRRGHHRHAGANPLRAWRPRRWPPASTCSSRSHSRRRPSSPIELMALAARARADPDVRTHLPLQPAGAGDQADDRGADRSGTSTSSPPAA